MSIPLGYEPPADWNDDAITDPGDLAELLPQFEAALNAWWS